MLKKSCRYWDATTKKFGFFIGFQGELAQLRDGDDKIFTVCPTKLHKANYWEGLRVRHVKHGTGVIDRWREGKWWVEWDNGCGLGMQDEKLIPLIEVGDRFAVARGITQECSVIEVIKGKKPYRIKWELKGEEWQVDIEFFRKFKRIEDNQINKGHKTMATTTTTFQFSSTQAIAQQIAQLQEQLNQLTSSLKPYQECEQKAEELRREVAEYSCEMTSKAIPPSDILSWAKSLYSAASGVEFVEGDSGVIAVIAAQNEEIAKLKGELASTKKLQEQALAQRNEALDKITDMTEQSLGIAEKLTQQVENKIVGVNPFMTGDKVEVVDADDEDNGPATVVGVKGNSVAVLIDAIDDEGQRETVLFASQLKKYPDKEPIEVTVARDRGREFITNIKSKVSMNNVAWTNISDVCQGSYHAFEEIHAAAAWKYQKDLIQKLPNLMADYIFKTGDTTDMQWTGEDFKSKVEELLEAKKQQRFRPGDWVKVIDDSPESGTIWQVRDFDGEWLSVQKDNKITSLHKSEVELVQQEVAA